MKDIIRNGHLYVAQPPLFKVKRGKTEVYIKDEEGLNKFLTESSLNDFSLEYGKENILVKGKPLLSLIKKSYEQTKLIKNNSKNNDVDIMQAIAVCGGFVDELLVAGKESILIFERILEHLNLNKDSDENWTGKVDYKNRVLNFNLNKNEIDKNYFISEAMITTIESKKINETAKEMQDIYEYGAKLYISGKEYFIKGPIDLYENIYFTTRKSYNIQRYKGLGEMNPGQLWDTTLDPDSRTLLKVQYQDEWAADELFGKLMGSNVEPRRNFIQKYALEAENIDI